MNAMSVAPHPHAVKHGRYVAPTAAQQEELERQIGRNLYRRGKPIRECVTDAMSAGWLREERRGADAYYRAMMADASSSASVNWTGEAW